MRDKGKRILSILLVFTMVIGLWPIASETAKAEEKIILEKLELSNSFVPQEGKEKQSNITIETDHVAYKSASWSGIFENNRFLGGETYTYSITVMAYAGYDFAEIGELQVIMDGVAPDRMEKTYLDGFAMLTVEYDYRIEKKLEIDTIKLEGSFHLPLAGEMIEYLSFEDDFNDPRYSSGAMFAQKTTSWYEADTGKLCNTETRFEYGVGYYANFRFEVFNSNGYVFADDVSLILKNCSDKNYTTKIVENTKNAITIQVTVYPKFPGGGDSEENPIECYSFKDLKAALESPDIQYVRLNDVDTQTHDNVYVEAAKYPGVFYPIVQYGNKTLIVDGHAFFQYENGDNYVGTPGGFIYVTGNLEVKGDGYIGYSSAATELYNAVFVNRENLTINGDVRIEGRVGRVDGHTYFGCAIYQNTANKNAKLTINGGTFESLKMIDKITDQAAVVVEGGTLEVNGGTFTCNMLAILQNKETNYGLWIKNNNVRATINGGEIHNMLLPGGAILRNYVKSNSKIMLDGKVLSHETTAEVLRGMVTVRQTIEKMDIYINSPEVGKTLWDTAYVGDQGIEVDAVRWHDLTTGDYYLDPSNTFIANHEYKVSVYLKAKNGYEFSVDQSGLVPTTKTNVNHKSAETYKVSGEDASKYVVVEYTFAPCPNQVHSIELTILPPHAGQTWAKQLSSSSNLYDLYPTDAISWYDATAGRTLGPYETFINGHSYEVEIWVEALKGYEFAVDSNLDPLVTATVNKNTAEVKRAYEQSADKVVAVQYDFGICDTYIDFVNVYNVVEPKAGMAPNLKANVQDADKYEIEHITWTGPEGLVTESDTFVKGYEYEVEIKLVPTKVGGINSYEFKAPLQGYVNGEELLEEKVFVSKNAVYLYRTFSCEGSASKARFAGVVTSCQDDNENIYIQLIPEGKTEAAYETVVKGNYVSYTIENVVPDKYIMKVIKKNHATRQYEIAVNAEHMQQDVSLYLSGDLNGDGKVNTSDVAITNAYVKGRISLDRYLVQCADVNGDGKVNTSDIGKINAHVKMTNRMW